MKISLSAQNFHATVVKCRLYAKLMILVKLKKREIDLLHILSWIGGLKTPILMAENRY